jgi:hypothetical protein
MFFVAVVLCAAPCAYAVTQDNSIDAKAEQAVQSEVTLPEDGATWHTVLFTSHDWRKNPKEREFVSWFETNPQLKKLTSQTKTHHLTPARLIYHWKWDRVVHNEFPCVIVEKCNGQKVYKISGKNVPNSADELAAAISNKLKNCPDGDCGAGRIFDRIRPRPNPGPCPAVSAVTAPIPIPSAPPVMDDVPDDAEETSEPAVHWGLVVALGLVGGVAAAFIMFKNAVNSI